MKKTSRILMVAFIFCLAAQLTYAEGPVIAGGAGGPGFNYSSNRALTDFNSESPTGNYDPGTGNSIYVRSILNLPTGTLTKIGALVDNVSTAGTHVKLALYDSSLNLIPDSSATISPPALSSPAWYEARINVSVTAGTYYIATVTDNENVKWGVLSSAGSDSNCTTLNNSCYVTGGTYSAFPPSTLTGTATRVPAVACGVYMTVPANK